MTFAEDKIAPRTTETHFTEPVKSEQTSYSIDRHIHRVPLDWFLVVSGRIDAWNYEHYQDNKDLFGEKPEQYTVEAVDFDYETEPNSDGTGKPFHILFNTPEGNEKKCYPRTHYLIWLLNYDEDSHEVVAVTPTDERDGTLVTIQERLPHIPTE